MVGRNPARFLAPIALVVFAFAFYSALKSDSSPESENSGNGTSQQQTATPTATAEKEATKPAERKTYTVKSGDTASGIAEQNDMDLETLMELNPKLDPATLSPGQKIRLSQ